MLAPGRKEMKWSAKLPFFMRPAYRFLTPGSQDGILIHIALLSSFMNSH
jgi:hypothetical protein